MKRFLLIVAILCLTITCSNNSVTAEAYDNLIYVISDGEVTITGCDTAASGTLEIPATIEGYPVTTIATSAFNNCSNLRTITIGKHVTSIGTGIFSGCSNLSAIIVDAENSVYHSAGNCLIETSSKRMIAGCKNSTIPDDGSVTSIDRLAYYKCSTLTAIAIPNTITSIGASAFEGCTLLSNLTIGNNVKSIGNSAFWGCISLTEVLIPDSVTNVGVYVLSGCTGLRSAAIGNNVSIISNSMFSGCIELTNLTLGTNVVTIDIFAFNGCSKLTEINIPNSVSSIGKFAFYNCSQLKQVRIPENLTSIGKNAFAGCPELTLSINTANSNAIYYAQNNGVCYTTYGIGQLTITTVTLRPVVTGIYFKSNLDWAENNADVLSYGIAVSVYNPLPVADESDKSCLCAQGGTSVVIKNIMKVENTSDKNSANASKPIYARVYVQLTSGEYIYGETVQVSLQWAVIAAQNNWNALSVTQKNYMKQMYSTYSTVMSDWNIPNLKSD